MIYHFTLADTHSCGGQRLLNINKYLTQFHQFSPSTIVLNCLQNLGANFWSLISTLSVQGGSTCLVMCQKYKKIICFTFDHFTHFTTHKALQITYVKALCSLQSVGSSGGTLGKSSHANICSRNQIFRENVVVIGFSELRPVSNERYENSTCYGPFQFLIFILIFN